MKKHKHIIAVALVLLTIFQIAQAQTFANADKDPEVLKPAYADIKARRFAEAEMKLRALTSSSDLRTATAGYEGFAQFFRVQGKFSEVVAAYDAALLKGVASDSDREFFHRSAGQAAVMANEYKSAIAHLQIWRDELNPEKRTQPTSSTPLAFLAIAQAETRQFVEAEQTIETAVGVLASPPAGLLAIRNAIASAASSPQSFQPGSIAAMVQRR